MPTSFMRSPQAYFTSESVTEGHPDKLCDQISDAVLDAILAEDGDARVACESAATTGLVVVFGEITTSTYVDIPRIARDVVRDIGYTSDAYGFDANTCGVITSIKEQSPDIQHGVDEALEVRSGEQRDQRDRIGAGDQGMMIGFACDETPELMPLPVSLAHDLTRRLAGARRDGSLPFLRPDGKSQVTVEYEYGLPKRVDTVLISTQHDEDISNADIRDGVIEEVIQRVIPAEMLDAKTKILVNPSGRFVIGGPMGDAGLTGRKIIVDTYGGMARHGGGAFSGKDPTKVDRSGAYAARYVAKNIVAAGLAQRCELQISYAIGVAHPLSLHVETFGTATVPDERLVALIQDMFDLRPLAIIEDLDLMRPIYRQVAAYGHFGRPDLDLPWERTDVADALRQAAGSVAASASWKDSPIEVTSAVITGATGFVGRHLIDELERETDWRIVGLGRRAASLGGRTRVLACDLRDADLVRRTIEHLSPDLIFHLASQSYVPQAVAAPADTLVNNLVGQLNVLEAVRGAGLATGVVSVCSAEEYGFVAPDEVPVDEDQPFRPGNPYAVSKIAQDMLSYQYALSYGMPVVRLRPFSHVGPGQSDRFVLSSFARQIAEAEAGRIEPVILTGNLDAVRDFLDVRDVVRAYRVVAGDIVPGDVFNLASGEGHRIGDLLDRLIAMARVPLEVRQDPARLRPSDVPVLVGDSTRFRARAGWRPLVPIETTLADILDDWRRRIAEGGR